MRVHYPNSSPERFANALDLLDASHGVDDHGLSSGHFGIVEPEPV